MSDQSQRPGAHRPGSIERTLAGDFDFRVDAVLREGWERIDGVKSIVAAGVLVLYAAIVLVVGAVTGITGIAPDDQTQGATLDLIVTLLIFPFQAGVFMFGLRRSLGHVVGLRDLFSAYGRALPIFAVGALQLVAIALGTLLFVVPGVYISIALFLAVPLKAERDLPVLACLEVSVRLVNRAFWRVLAIQLISVALIVLGIVSVIGWIWTVPWVVMIYGITYRQLAGVAGSGRPGDTPPAGNRTTAEY